MLDKRLKEAIELLGGKAVIKDDNQYFVLLSLKEFRRLKQDGVEGLTKQELVDKINNDIASWKVLQEEEGLADVNLTDIEENEEEIHYEKAS